MWVSAEAFGEAPLRFKLLVDFSADEGAADLLFMKEIMSMSDARKANERFRSPELMASNRWFPSFPPNSEDALPVERAPSHEALPASLDLQGVVAI